MLLFESFATAQSINLPGKPKIFAPPPQKSKSLNDTLNRLKQRREKRSRSEQVDSRPSASKSQRATLTPIISKPVDGFLSIGLTLPHALLSDPQRSDYKLEPGIELQWLNGYGQYTKQWRFYYGLRLYTVSGAITENRVPGRMGFTYLGPAVGFGKWLSSGENRDASAAPGDGISNTSSNLPSRSKELGSGILIQGGLSALINQSQPAPTDKDLGFDLKAKTLTFDSPGLWVCGKWYKLLRPSLSINIDLGLQLGQGKTIIWAAFGTGLWL